LITQPVKEAAMTVSNSSTPLRRQRRETLSDTQVAKLARKARKVYFHPDPELPKHGVRFRPGRPGAYTIVTRVPDGKQKKQKWVKIGNTAEMTIEDAREKARTVIKRLEAGLTPFEPPLVKADTVADVIEGYCKRHVEARGLRTSREIRRILQVHILPRWRDRPFAEIKRSDIAKLLDSIEDKHGAWVADGVLAILSGLASWFASRNDDYQLPFTRGMKRVPKDARKRARILDDAELRSVWRAAEGAGVYGGLVRLLLLTAQRRDKVCGMRWDDISPDGTWTIRTEPGEKGNAGALKLPEAALSIIRSMPHFASNPHVFAGAGGGATANFSKDKIRFDAASGVSGWTLHDLRRTARSLLSRAGVRPDIAERVLGHVVTGVEGVYDRHTYHDEKADALVRLAALLERIVNPPEGNVVPLHEAAVS
jgi:integrase